MERKHHLRRILNKLNPKHDAESEPQPLLTSQTRKSDHGLPQILTSLNNPASNSGVQPLNSSESQDSTCHLNDANRPQNGIVSFDKPADLPTPTISRSNTANGLEQVLPPRPKDTDIPNGEEYLKDMEFLTLGGDSRSMTQPSLKRYNKDIADRKILSSGTGAFPVSSTPSLSHRRSVSIESHPRGNLDPFSQDVANRNLFDSPGAKPSMAAPDFYTLDSQEHMFQRIATNPYFSGEHYAPPFEQRRGFDSQKGSSISAPWEMRPNQVSLGQQIDADSNTFGTYASSPSSDEVRTGPQPVMPPTYESLSIEHNASQTLGHVQGQPKQFPDLDSTDTTDTDADVNYAPSVKHEIVYPEHSEIRQEQVTREIHNHDVYHRILPIREVKVLPARHFTRSSSGTLTEIPAPKGRSEEQQNWQIVQTKSRQSSMQPTSSRRQFSARNFEGGEGSHEEYVGDDGVPRTETTWIHPPTIEEGGCRTEQTAPLYMDEISHPLYGNEFHQPTIIPGACFDGLLEPDMQYSNRFCDFSDMAKQVRRRPVAAKVVQEQ